MSLKRTPPIKITAKPAEFQTAIPYASDSNTPDQQDYESGSSASFNIPVTKSRKESFKKRKRGDIDVVSKAEVLEMFKALRGDQDDKFSAVLQSNTEIKATLDFMSTKYDEIVTRLHAVEDDNKSLVKRVLFLESQLEIQNRNARCSSIEIRNIPQNQKESKKELAEIIKKTADFLNIPLANTEIKDVYRINTKATIKPIIADFTTVPTRDHFISSYKKYNKEHRGAQLNTANIRMSGPSKPIYISENLTQKDRRLYYLAREFASGNGFSFCWVSYGKIYLRKAEGAPPIRIAAEEDIEKLRNK